MQAQPTTPDVSIIIPAYNTELYIAQAIDSALGQTFKNIEVIVVDDASTDSTLAIAQAYTDPRLRVIGHSKNLGAGAARNTALDAAQGQWIAVLDSDDWFAADRVESLLHFTEIEDTEFIADDLFFILDGETKPRSTLLEESGSFIKTPQFIDPLLFVET